MIKCSLTYCYSHTNHHDRLSQSKFEKKKIVRFLPFFVLISCFSFTFCGVFTILALDIRIKNSGPVNEQINIHKCDCDRCRIYDWKNVISFYFSFLPLNMFMWEKHCLCLDIKRERDLKRKIKGFRYKVNLLQDKWNNNNLLNFIQYKARKQLKVKCYSQKC